MSFHTYTVWGQKQGNENQDPWLLGSSPVWWWSFYFRSPGIPLSFGWSKLPSNFLFFRSGKSPSSFLFFKLTKMHMSFENLRVLWKNNISSFYKFNTFSFNTVTQALIYILSLNSVRSQWECYYLRSWRILRLMNVYSYVPWQIWIQLSVVNGLSGVERCGYESGPWRQIPGF